MDIRTPSVAILVTSILIIIFVRKGLPQLISSRIFFTFLNAVFVNNLFEIFECVVFYYFEGASPVLKRVAQNGYVVSLLASSFVMCIYVYSKTNRHRVVDWRAFLIGVIPMVIAVVGLIIGSVRYGYEDGRYYNYGTGIGACYAVGFIYILVTLIRLVGMRKRVSMQDFWSIFAGLVICHVFAVVQYSKRDEQVLSVALMLTSLIVFIMIENPREFYEKSRDSVRNNDAFIMTISEKLGLNRHFFIVSVVMTGKTAVMSTTDRGELIEKQDRVAKLVEKYVGTSAYLCNWNTLCFIVDSPQRVEKIMDLVKEEPGSNYRFIQAMLEVPKYADTVEKIMQILSFVSGEYVYTYTSPFIAIDNNIVDKMEYRNTIEEVVRKATKEKAFDVYYQPILCVKDGTFSSAEALVRLRRSENGNYISPEDFIPVAERCGLIQEIDDLVFEKVCSFIARENLQSYGIKMVEVNLSGNEVVDEHTHARLISKMNKYHIPPKFINFEITETSYISNDEIFKENVSKLREEGSTFSMDDFGSGYSNLLEILKMDYALVKLDKEFVWNCLDKNRPENMRMLDYTLKFLSDYGLHILAEGVETLEQAKILIEKGVEYLQGFYYSRPVPEEEYIDFLKSQKGYFEELSETTGKETK